MDIKGGVLKFSENKNHCNYKSINICTLAYCLSKSIACEFSRIQFTSDLLPVARSFRLQRDAHSDERPDQALLFRRKVGAAMARRGSLAFLYHDPRSWVARILPREERRGVAGIACLSRT